MQADRPGSSTLIDTEEPEASTSSQVPLEGVDHQYFSKVIFELQVYRQRLILREVELESLRTGIPDEHKLNPNTQKAVDLETLQRTLTRAAADLSLLRAEQKSIQSIIDNLRTEKHNFAEFKDRITREVDARMAIKQINGVASRRGDSMQESDVERTLRTVVSWIEGTIEKWENVSEIHRLAQDYPTDPPLQNDPAPDDGIPVDPGLRESKTATA